MALPIRMYMAMVDVHLAKLALLKCSLFPYAQVAMSDFGNYTCLASNDGGSSWTSFPLSLTPAQPPDVPLNCSETRVEEDLTISISCVAGFDGGAPQKVGVDTQHESTLTSVM